MNVILFCGNEHTPGRDVIFAPHLFDDVIASPFLLHFFFFCFNDLGFSDLGPNAAMPRLKCPDALWSEKEKIKKIWKFGKKMKYSV